MSVTRTFTFGTTGGSAANAPRLYLVSGASIPTITTGSWLSEIDFGTTAFTIAATNLNLSSLKSNSSTSVLTALTATMVGTGSIRTNTSIGPLVINTSAITTTLAGTTLCTTAALTQGTLDLAGNTLTCSSTFTYNGGSLLLASSILNCTTFTVNGPAFDFTTGTITPSTSFVLTSGSFTLNGGTLSAVPAFTHTAGTATFNTGYALTATGTYTLTAGTLSLPDGVTLSTGIFSSTNTNTRSIAFGATTAGYVSLTHTTAATTRLSMAIATGFTESGPGGFTSSMDVTATFTFGTTGGSSSNAPRLLITGGAAIPTFTTGSWFDLLDFTGNTSTPAATVLNLNALTLAVGGTYTALSATMVGTGSILSNGKTIAAFTINSTSGTTTLGDALALIATGTSTLTSGTLDLNGFDLTTGIFASTGTATRAIAFGTNNIVLAHTTAAQTVLSFATATGFTYTGTGGFRSDAAVTRTFTFGTTGGSSSNAPNLSITSGASILTFTTGSWFNLLDFTGNTSTPAATVLNLNALTLASGGTYTALGATMVGTGIITPSGKTIAAFTVNNGAGTVTLAAALSVTTYTQTAGTIDFATFNLTCSGAAAYTSGTLNNIGTITCTTWTVTGAFTFGQGTITPSTSFVLTSGSFTYNSGATLSAVPTFTHTAGTVTLNQSYALTATGTYTLTAGTLTLADGVILDTGIFSSTNTNTRSIAFGTSTAGNISLTHTTAATTRLSMAIVTGFTKSGLGGFTSSMGVTATFTFGTTGGSFSNAPTLYINGGAAIPTFTTGSWFDLLDFTGNTSTPAVTFLNIKSLTLASGGTYTNLSVNMMDIGTITPNGKTIAAFTVNHLSTTTLAGALGVTTYTQTSGTMDFATFNLTGSGAASYTGGSLINLGTLTCTTFTINGPNYTFSSGTITPSTSFVLTSGSFTYSVGATLSAVPTFTHTAGTVTLNQSYALTTTGTYTLTAGTLTLADGVTVNTGIFSSTGAGIRAIAFGGASAGNINLTHTTAATVVLNMAALGGFSFTGTGGFTVANMSNTRTFSVGSTSGGSATIAPSLTFTTGASIATLTTASWFKTLNFGTTAFNPGTTALNIAGDLTLSSSGTYTTLTPTIRGTGTITSNGKTIPALILNTTGTATLADALTASGALTLTQGSLDCSTFSVISATFASTGTLTRSMTGSGTYTITGTGATAFSNASATGIAITGLIISMTAASAKTFAGGSGSFSTLNQGGAGALTISGNNSFDNLTATTRPSTITFTASSTQTFADFTLSGVLGSLVTINSSIAATRATLSKGSGTVSVGFLSIRDSNATGGAEWYAGTTSTNVSNNLGWIFTAPPAGANAGNFFAFF
jgi:fibronectin-binding autotransporter adhesin